MKKLLKISLLVALFMSLLTIASNAATVDYKSNANGTVDVTIKCEGEIDDAAKQVFESAQYKVDVNAKTATNSYNVSSGPKFIYFEFEDICVATPYTMNIGESRTIEASSTITNTTDASIVEITDGKRYTAKKAGEATITINANNTDHPKEIYELKITVKDGSSTSDGATDFSNAKFTFEADNFNVIPAKVTGVTLEKDHFYSAYVSKDATGTQQDTSKTAPLSNIDGENVITFTKENAHVLSEYAGDRYIHIIDKYFVNSDTKYNITSIKITDENIVSRPLGSRFDVYLYSADKSYINNNIYAASGRKVYYKVGIVTSNDVLRAFKNDTASGFSKLLTYAKEDNSKLKDGSFELADNSMDTLDYNLVHDANPTDGTYYYIYYSIDTEDGKYIPVEDVQIYKGLSNGTIVHFAYGSIDVSDSDENSAENQEEKLPDRLANTGEKALVIALIGITAVVSVILFKKNKGLKIK